jgi:hypothetical protein
MKLWTIFVVALCILTGVLPLAIKADYVQLDTIKDLNLDLYKSQWKNKGAVTFENQGINISLVDKAAKISISIRERNGRDVKIKIDIPGYIVSPSALGNINTDDGTAIIWRVKQNSSYIELSLRALQRINFDVGKGSLVLGRIRKAVHNTLGYVEYYGDSDGASQNIVVYIDKSEPGFNIDNKHMIVQYKTSFFGWYYPVDDVSSRAVYYYVDDIGSQYRVVTHFNSNISGDVKIEVFPGASTGIFNWEAFKGLIARTFISIQIGIKKAIVDIIGDKTPKG